MYFTMKNQGQPNQDGVVRVVGLTLTLTLMKVPIMRVSTGASLLSGLRSGFESAGSGSASSGVTAKAASPTAPGGGGRMQVGGGGE
jgi:hypothetical protein